MKRMVVDASVTLKWIFLEEGSGKAKELLKDYLEGKITLVAPKLWSVEVANAIRSAVHAKKITNRKGHELLIQIYKAKPRLVETEEIMGQAFDNACSLDISVYDSLYLTLAWELKIKFATSDQKLLAKLSPKVKRYLI